MARGFITRARRRRAAGPLVALLGLTYLLCPEALAAGEQAATGAQVATAAKQKHDPAEAQRAVANAGKLLEAGKHDQAIATLSATLAGGNLAPATMAKALLYRGIAYRQQKKPAQAISDFTSALWLKGGLSEADRADGLRQRAGAYQEAGLSQGGEVQPATKDTRAKERAASPSAAAAWDNGTTTTAPPVPATALNQEQSSPPASGGGWGLFGNLFGGAGNALAGAGAAPAATAPADAAAILNAETTTAERPTAARRASASGWSRQAQVEGERSARVESARVENTRVENTRVENTRVETGAIAAKSEPVKKAAALPEPAKTGRHMRIQIAAVRTQAEAKLLAAKVMREHATTLAAHEPQIDQTVMGNMGSFYRVLLGPFASAQETQSVCAKLKGSGLDCLVMAQ
ncbi:MAG TPA: SPOR domain-containing protein [Hyphomicrobiaceae bacterium]|nr:SPOR domain-containing protein [Hyphomicrobiaceae bacterium]